VIALQKKICQWNGSRVNDPRLTGLPALVDQELRRQGGKFIYVPKEIVFERAKELGAFLMTFPAQSIHTRGSLHFRLHRKKTSAQWSCHSANSGNCSRSNTARFDWLLKLQVYGNLSRSLYNYRNDLKCWRLEWKYMMHFIMGEICAGRKTHLESKLWMKNHHTL